MGIEYRCISQDRHKWRELDEPFVTAQDFLYCDDNDDMQLCRFTNIPWPQSRCISFHNLLKHSVLASQLVHAVECADAQPLNDSLHSISRMVAQGLSWHVLCGLH